LFFVSMAICTKAWFDGIVGRHYSWVKTARSAERHGAGIQRVGESGFQPRTAGASAFAAVPDELA
jgi:hypothetical protein